MVTNLTIATAILSVVVVALAIYAYQLFKRSRAYEKRFANVLDIDAEVAAGNATAGQLREDINSLRAAYKEKKNIFDGLLREVAIYDEEIELAELGFYKPHFAFDTSDKYKEEIQNVRAAQKQMLSDKAAIVCHTEWVVEGSKAKGKTMTNRAIRLTARAFNNECDSAISSVSWNNAQRMEERIKKVYESINKLNVSNTIEITSAFLQLKIRELQLAHEYKDKKQREKEEQAEIRRQMREETKLQKEVENALKEEGKYEKLLEKARKEAATAKDEALVELQARIESLSSELDAAHAKSERALSMAQQTRAGHVYIISNIGSFGPGIYKIGMTRRLDPIDRVNELGDASVPFVFDTHALIYSEDAPGLESALHKAFDDRRINLVNSRKEFFKIELDEVKAKVMKLIPDAEFITKAESREYRETLAVIRQKELANEKNKAVTAYPDEI